MAVTQNAEHPAWPVDKAADQGRTDVLSLQDQIPEAHLLQLVLQLLQHVRHVGWMFILQRLFTCWDYAVLMTYGQMILEGWA